MISKTFPQEKGLSAKNILIKNKDMKKDELLELFDRFLKENGLWYSFSDWLLSIGYTEEDLGFKDE